MAGRKTVDVINILIPNGIKTESAINRRLDRGIYDRFQIIKRNDAAKAVTAQIEITDGTDDLISRSAIEAYDRKGGSFKESMPEIKLADDTEINITITADAAPAEDATYQILFFKKLSCNA